MSNTDDKIIKAFQDIGFEVQCTSYDYLIKTTQLAYLCNKELPSNEASKILKAFPNLFVVHRSANPEKAVFFVITDDKLLDKEIIKIYKKYYPPEILVVTEQKNNIVCKWLHDPSKDSFKPIKIFFEEHIGIKNA